jgi:peptidoglycan/xylan/chitin deacetylase (PgdA/CDA1 family)
MTELEAAVGLAREIGRVVSVTELIRRHSAGKSTAGLFAITFDDAYFSLFTAQDFLAREDVPVTIFAIPNALDDARRFWWDRLSAVLEQATQADVDALSDQFGIPQSFRDTQGRGWGLGRPLRQWVIARYAARWPEEYEESLQKLEQAKGVTATDRSMTWDELDSFAARAPVEVGVHTCTHPALPLISYDEQMREIGLGFNRLRERFPATVPVLAAPFGLYNRDTVAATQSLGLLACLSLGTRTLRFAGDTGALPRFCMMHPETPFKLAMRLSGMMDQARQWQGDVRIDYPVPPTLNDTVARY